MENVKSKTIRQKVAKVKKLMNLAGTNIGSVTFIKRGDKKIRRIAYRLHCQHPTFASIPRSDRSERNKEHNLITVLDMNQPIYNRKGHIIGRGAWKSIPLDTVLKVKAGGVIYKLNLC